MVSAFLRRMSCSAMAAPRFLLTLERVTTIPAAVEISSEGIWETSPSPTVRIV